jgi:hypothetical protein
MPTGDTISTVPCDRASATISPSGVRPPVTQMPGTSMSSATRMSWPPARFVTRRVRSEDWSNRSLMRSPA